MVFFDDLETRSSDQRSTESSVLLKEIIQLAANLEGYRDTLGRADSSIFNSLDDLPSLPVLRKS